MSAAEVVRLSAAIDEREAARFASQWITADQAGARMPAPVSGSQVRKLVATGVIPPGVAAKVGKRVFIHAPRLEQWLAAGGSLSTPASPAKEV